MGFYGRVSAGGVARSSCEECKLGRWVEPLRAQSDVNCWVLKSRRTDGSASHVEIIKYQGIEEARAVNAVL
jgi:hypothetical protein